MSLTGELIIEPLQWMNLFVQYSSKVSRQLSVNSSYQNQCINVILESTLLCILSCRTNRPWSFQVWPEKCPSVTGIYLKRDLVGQEINICGWFEWFMWKISAPEGIRYSTLPKIFKKPQTYRTQTSKMSAKVLTVRQSLSKYCQYLEFLPIPSIGLFAASPPLLEQTQHAHKCTCNAPAKSICIRSTSTWNYFRWSICFFFLQQPL